MSRSFALASLLAAGMVSLPMCASAQEGALDAAPRRPVGGSEVHESPEHARTPSGGGESSGDPLLMEEIRALRRAAEQQSKQLDAIALQIARLSQRIEGGNARARTPAPAASSSAPAAASEPAATIPAPEAAAAPAPAVSEPPKAEPPTAPAVAGPKHTVAKGETLTSIAKRYNIPIAELQKANNIKDDRKLQIGQALTLPPGTPAPPAQPQTPPETSTSTDKKENR